MTHVLGFFEGYWDAFIKFMEFWKDKYYADGKARVRPRILIPIHFGVNEVGREEFLEDLKSFSCFTEFDLDKAKDKYKNMEEAGPGAKNKFFKMVKWFRKLFPMVKDINFDKVKDSNLRATETKKGNHFMGAFYPIGEMSDMKLKENDEEIV